MLPEHCCTPATLSLYFSLSPGNVNGSAISKFAALPERDLLQRKLAVGENR